MCFSRQAGKACRTGPAGSLRRKGHPGYVVATDGSTQSHDALEFEPRATLRVVESGRSHECFPCKAIRFCRLLRGWACSRGLLISAGRS
jgi:hypothetical protein